MKLKFKLAQLNLFVGNFKHNFNKIKNIINQALKDNTDIVVFPELAATGYPPEDLLFKKSFIDDNLKVLKNIASLCKDLVCVIGFVNRIMYYLIYSAVLYNYAAVIHNKKIQYIYNKINLPNYSVFDEKRYFKPGNKTPVIDLKGIRFGLCICEDLWADNSPLFNPSQSGKTDFIITINASPYYTNKYKDRIKQFKELSKKTKNHIIYLNMVGAQDEIVFDGNSLVFDNNGKILKAGAQFKEDIIDFILDFKEKDVQFSNNASSQEASNQEASSKEAEQLKNTEYTLINNFKPKKHTQKSIALKEIKFLPDIEEIYSALVLGTRDYVLKNNFKKVVIALSGGIDSALTTVIAVDALGYKNVETIFMPTRFSSTASYKDAEKLAKNFKVKFSILSIEKIFKTYLHTLSPIFKNMPFNKAEENIQARIRGNLLMACSNKFGNLVLATGNKSEMSTGYATLYGDMAGGFAVLKDVYKTLVYKLAKNRNKKAGFDLIPKNILFKAPTAELKENQKDSDTLPEYEILDKILYHYIEKLLSLNEITKQCNINKKTVKKVINMVDHSEYKRRQAPPGIKITRLSFGKDRRMPITNGYVLK